MDWIFRAARPIDCFINDPDGYIDRLVSDQIMKSSFPRIRNWLDEPRVFTCKYCGRRYKEPQESCRGCGADVF